MIQYLKVATRSEYSLETLDRAKQFREKNEQYSGQIQAAR